VLDNPIVGMMSPRAQQAGQLMGRAAPVLRGAPAAAGVACVAEAIVPAVESARTPRYGHSLQSYAGTRGVSAAGETAHAAAALA
jgi:hypothetical protein